MKSWILFMAVYLSCHRGRLRVVAVGRDADDLDEAEQIDDGIETLGVQWETGVMHGENAKMNFPCSLQWFPVGDVTTSRVDNCRHLGMSMLAELCTGGCRL